MENINFEEIIPREHLRIKTLGFYYLLDDKITEKKETSDTYIKNAIIGTFSSGLYKLDGYELKRIKIRLLKLNPIKINGVRVKEILIDPLDILESEIIKIRTMYISSKSQ